MQEMWKQLSERRAELLIKREFKGLTGEEEGELSELEEFIDTYVELYLEAHPGLQTGLEAVLDRNGIN